MTTPEHDLSRLRISRDPVPADRRGALKWVVAIVVVVAGSAAAWVLRRERPIEVSVAAAEVVGGGGGSGVSITANGYVVARTQASVSSKVAGRLEYLGVAEGSVMRRGEIIGRLENQEARASVDRARADLETARATLGESVAEHERLERDLGRATDLLAKNLGSRQSVEDLASQVAAAVARVKTREAQIASAEASVAVAQANLENTMIRAPFDGTVLRKDAEVGEVVAPVATGGGLTRGAVVTMADLRTLEVEVDVNEAYIAQLKEGQAAQIVLDAYPGRRFKGEIRRIVPTANRQKATVLVKVRILDRDPSVLPEMGARVEFLEPAVARDSAPTAQRIFVPASAVRAEGSTAIVWLVGDGRLAKRPVEAGPVSGGRREIRSGLSGGEQVVVSGPEGLKAGGKVMVKP